MKGLLAQFTVTPLLWACGLLLVALAVLGGLLYKSRADIDVANAASRSAMALADARGTEREAWKRVAGTQRVAIDKWQAAFTRVHMLLLEEQGERKRLGEAGEAAIAAAQAQAAEADRTLSAWMQRYADQVRVGDCAAALNAVQQACPALGGY